tara:strand:- start:189 stop:476 length:288 start_codon:yes stop_codon:yes gene_type:complete
LGEVGIWIAVILIGLVTLGLREYARTSGTFAARLEKIRITLLATTLILLGITATVLAIGFIVAVVLVEIWRPSLVAMAVVGGLLASIFWLRSPSK